MDETGWQPDTSPLMAMERDTEDDEGDSEGWSAEGERNPFPLHDAAQAGDLQMIRKLLNIHATEESEWAGYPGDEQTEKVQQRQLDVRLFERDDLGHTPLHVSLLHFQLETVAFLLKHGSPAGMNAEGFPPLHIAVSAGAFSAHGDFAVGATTLLLQNGANIAKQDDWHSNALHIAARIGRTDLLQVLLNFGLELLRDKEHYLSESIIQSSRDGSEGKEKTCALIAALYTVDRSGETPFHAAASANQPNCLKLLLSAVGEIHNAVPEAHLMENVEFLNLKDGRLNPPATCTNKKGWTPIHSAAHAGSASCISVLCRSNGGKEALALKDQRGLTAKEMATRNGYHHVVSAMQESPQDSRSFTEIPGRTDSLEEEQFFNAQPTVNNKVNQTLLLHHEACLKHLTCDPANLRRGRDFPPENLSRLRVLLDDEFGVLKADEFSGSTSIYGTDVPRYRWEADPPLAPLADILRVHSWPYIQRIKQKVAIAAARELLMGGTTEDVPSEPVLVHLDGDTVVSAGTWDAARYAAGAVLKAVDEVVAGKARNAFAAIRPPGHHAGPEGPVVDLEKEEDSTTDGKHGSLGFCLVNNVAVGAAYALHVHRSTIQRLAILDFDVHHGNGTEAILQRVVPTKKTFTFSTPYSEGTQAFPLWSPWLDDGDKDRIFFASVQGYGIYGSECTAEEQELVETAAQGAFFYPGTGKTRDSRTGTAEIGGDVETGYNAGADGPRVINVGINGPGSMRGHWRRSWRDKILPELVSFNPDIIFISAGFDAHKKDEMNSGFIGLVEADYDWVTRETVKVANRCCEGRVISVLEGGYKIGSRFVSAFARSVATHVRALGNASNASWDPLDAKREQETERRKRMHGSKLSKEITAHNPDQNHGANTLGNESNMDGAPPSASGAAPDQIQEKVQLQGAQAGKRRRSAVDYVSLNQQLEEELHDGKDTIES
uniref:Histone deacetylase domain-containing protein n=1 Tax=Picocystis salinarum TaxID=88271 RepID=A0A7S3UAV6_9CHLO